MGFKKLNFLSEYFKPGIDPIDATEKLSITDGIFWAVYTSMTSTFVVPLSIIMLGPSAPIGYIVGLPVLLVPAAQHSARILARRTSDLKKLTIRTTLFDRLLWIPVIFLIFAHGYILRLSLLLVFLSLRTYFSSLSGTTWTLWVPSVVPESHRSIYFARRNAAMKIFSLMGYLVALGIFLRIPGRTISVMLVFLVGTLLFSNLSLYIMSRIPKFNLKSEERTPGSPINTEFKIFLIFSAIWYFGSSSSSPFFQLFIISGKFLAETQTFYTVVFIVMGSVSFATQMLWGRFSSRNGHLRTIILSAFFLIAGTLLINEVRVSYEIFLPAILIGAGQSGTALSIFNEMIGRAYNSKISSVSLYNLVQSIFSSLGPIMANFIYDLHPSSLLPIFILSSIAMSASLMFLYRFHHKSTTTSEGLAESTLWKRR